MFLHRKIFFSSFIRPFLKGYLKFCIASLITIEGVIINYVNHSDDVRFQTGVVVINVLMRFGIAACDCSFPHHLFLEEI